MSAHPHADKMLQYAHDAQKTDKPWLLWEWRRGGIIFTPCNGSPHCDETSEYRRKPETIEVNGFTVPAPLRVVPEPGTHVYMADPSNLANGASKGWVVEFCWSGERVDCVWFDRGLLHATLEGAVDHAKAMCGIDPGAPE